MTVKTQTEINNIIWKACDTFRGVIDPSQYKDYILVMLFVKYLSDLYQDKLAEYESKYQGDAVRVERAMNRERFNLPEKARFDYLYEQRTANNIGQLIDEALALIEDYNKEKLEDVFRNISFNNENTLAELPPKKNNKTSN
jgi:type I restriction enzyme M protein